ncbi:MAG: DUF2851 family protein [Crocinitomicaceae bacterium]|nr:DUF2851 family protein [Crocinitomicaceae bacterium]
MKEEYLHYLWKMKRIPFHQMHLQDGRLFRVISSGIHNENNDGPDFYDARIEIDGLIWVGPVELHVKSSDWYLHKHQFDTAYDNVILHVVYEDNQLVYQNDRLIPSLELKSIIDSNHFSNYFKLKNGLKNVLTCSPHLHAINEIYISSTIDRALVSRMERKLADIIQMGLIEPSEVLYRLIAKAFGSKVNQLPFEELTIRLPYSLLRQLNKRKRKLAIEYASGLFHPNRISEFLNEERNLRDIASLNIGSVNNKSWKFAGVRPTGFPTIRIQQFAEFINYFNVDEISPEISPIELLVLIENAIAKVNNQLTGHLKISKALGELIIINAFVPFLIWLAKSKDRMDSTQSGVELLRLLSPESNAIISSWKRYGIIPKNAQESQGLIELYNEHCLKKKCLSCGVGNKILNR